MGGRTVVVKPCERSTSRDTGNNGSLLYSLGSTYKVMSRTDDKSGPKLKTNYPTVESLIQSSVGLGYLLAFTKREYNDENLKFCLAISGYTRDMKLPGFNPAARTKSIYETFCCSSGSSQISLDAKTQKALNHDIAAGRCDPKVFEGSLRHVVRTLSEDIFPRFRRSDLMKEMETYELQTDIKLSVPSPDDDTVGEIENFMTSHETFCIQRVLDNKTIYDAFLDHARRRYSEENLLCLKSILMFEDAMRDGNIQAAKDIEWGIYHVYIKPDAPSAIVVSPAQTQSLANQLASPAPGMFSYIEKMCRRLVYTDYVQFAASDEFPELLETLRRSRDEANNCSPRKKIASPKEQQGGGGGGGARRDCRFNF